MAVIDPRLVARALSEVGTSSFEKFGQSVESKINIDLVEYIDRLLIRSYFYARLAPVDGVISPNSFSAYISQFATHSQVRSRRADQELASYLIRRFDMSYETTEDMEEGIDKDELKKLAELILQVRTAGGYVKQEGEKLAYNDALHILRVFRRRQLEKENSPGSQWG